MKLDSLSGSSSVHSVAKFSVHLLANIKHITTLYDRLILLKEGRISADGTPVQVLTEA